MMCVIFPIYVSYPRFAKKSKREITGILDKISAGIVFYSCNEKAAKEGVFMSKQLRGVHIAAHRGTAGGNIPCNTLPAYELALRDGADIIELDVARSADGVLLCFHPGMEHVMYADPTPIAHMSGQQAQQRLLRNQDLSETVYTAPLLDEALELLKDRCQVAVDKFWMAMPEIAACIRRHGMAEQVLCKIPGAAPYYEACAQIAPDLPILPVLRGQDPFTGTAVERAIRQAGVEVLFAREDEFLAGDEYIDFIHRRGQRLWVNAIVYNRTDILSAGHTDDRAVAGDPEGGWGWLIGRGFDIIQTDFTAQLKRYLGER